MKAKLIRTASRIELPQAPPPRDLSQDRDDVAGHWADSTGRRNTVDHVLFAQQIESLCRCSPAQRYRPRKSEATVR